MLVLMAEAVRYFLGACIGLSVDWVTWYAACMSGLDPLMAQGIGKAAGAIFAFYIYRTRVFAQASQGPRNSQALRFLVAAAGGWCVGVTAFLALESVLPPILAKVASDGITFSLNWLVMRGWVFRTPRKPA